MFWMRVSRRAGASPQINNEVEMTKIKTPSTILSLRDISISVSVMARRRWFREIASLRSQ